MANTDYASVDEYLAAQPQDVQKVLKRVRTILRGALPKAVEGISYQIPTYKIDGRAVIYFAGWKAHFSLYPLGELVTETLAKELAAYEVSKGTVRFPLAGPIPTHLIQRIAKLRAETMRLLLEAKARAKGNPAAKPKTKGKAKAMKTKAVAKTPKKRSARR